MFDDLFVLGILVGLRFLLLVVYLLGFCLVLRLFSGFGYLIVTFGRLIVLLDLLVACA